MLGAGDSHFNYRRVYKGQSKVKVHVFEGTRTGKRRGYSSTLYPTYEDALRQYKLDRICFDDL